MNPAGNSLSNLAEVRRVVSLLDPASKRRFAVLFGLMVVNGLLESVNVGMFLPLIAVVLTPAGPGHVPFIGPGLDWLARTFDIGPLLAVTVIFLVVFLFKNAFLAWSIYRQVNFIARMRARMTSLIVEGYTRKPYEEHLSINSANAVYDISQNAPNVVSAVLQPALGIVLEAMLALGAAVALFIVHPQAALLGVVIVGLALGVYYKGTRRLIYRFSERCIDLGKTSTRWAHFALGSAKENLVLGRAGYFTRRIRSIADAQAHAEALLGVMGQMPRIYGELAVFLALAAVVGLIILQTGSVTGALPVLGVFGAAALRVFPSANRIVWYATSLRQAAPSVSLVYDDMRAAREAERQAALSAPPPQTAAIPFTRELRLDNVSYKYPTAREPTLRDIAMTIRKNEVVAFVGRTGAGKSTLADVILGLLPPTGGRILLDGVPVPPLPNYWRGRIGFVPQSIFLLDDTLRRNVAFGMDDGEIDDARVREVLRIARLDEMAGGLADGLDTMIGERGIRLSGGQRQRIGIARALYIDPEVLVLDEATSSLDSSTEREITDAIETLSGRKTVILIAHRLSTVQGCDRLFFLDRGGIAAQGTFAEVLAASAEFRAMVEQARLRPAHAIDAVA
jgi:ATP-binding cassette subfamily C protein